MEKKPIFILIGGLVGLAIVILIVQLISSQTSSGTLTITNLGGAITVAVKDIADETVFETAAESSTSTRLGGGDYAIKISRGDAVSQYSVVVENRQETIVSASFRGTAEPQLVANNSATSLGVYNNRLQYLRPDMQRVYAISPGQQPKEI